MKKILKSFLFIVSCILFVVGFSIWIFTGICGFIIELRIVNEAAGFWGIVIAFTILPLTLAATPFYAGIAHGNWFPLVLIGGGALSAAFIYGCGMIIREYLEYQEINDPDTPLVF